MKDLKEAIEIIAADEKITKIEAISLMQAGAAKVGDDETMEALCALKMEYIKNDFPWISE